MLERVNRALEPSKPRPRSSRADAEPRGLAVVATDVVVASVLVAARTHVLAVRISSASASVLVRLPQLNALGAGSAHVHRAIHTRCPVGATRRIQGVVGALPAGIAAGSIARRRRRTVVRARASRARWRARVPGAATGAGLTVVPALTEGRAGDAGAAVAAPAVASAEGAAAGRRAGPRRAARVAERAIARVFAAAGSVGQAHGRARPRRANHAGRNRPARRRCRPVHARSVVATLARTARGRAGRRARAASAVGRRCGARDASATPRAARVVVRSAALALMVRPAASAVACRAGRAARSARAGRRIARLSHEAIGRLLTGRRSVEWRVRRRRVEPTKNVRAAVGGSRRDRRVGPAAVERIACDRHGSLRAQAAGSDHHEEQDGERVAQTRLPVSRTPHAQRRHDPTNSMRLCAREGSAGEWRGWTRTPPLVQAGIHTGSHGVRELTRSHRLPRSRRPPREP